MKTKILLVIVVLLCTSMLVQAKSNLSLIEKLGKNLYNDKDLSFNGTQSCKSCHHPRAGFADPSNLYDPYVNVVSVGADGFSLGGRNAPTASYSGFSPVLQQDSEGTWFGGMFWDGRATGHRLGDPIAEQALGPFLNPVEMAMPSKAAVVGVVQCSHYAWKFLAVFGPNAFDDVDTAYDNIGIAIAAFERSTDLVKFNSRFDDFWRACDTAGIDVANIDATNVATVPQGVLTPQELNGLVLFNTKAQCAACHLTAVDPNAGYPLFTDFTYDNLGIPVNPLLAGNPTDYGLGAFLGDAAENGKFKVSTLRNIGLTPPYGHNGFFPTLKDIVHFYNTRDVGMWPPPEVPQNVNTDELGDLGLTDAEENDIVAFLLTLSDHCK
jgi:cytochrome c peroxidase